MNKNANSMRWMWIVKHDEISNLVVFIISSNTTHPSSQQVAQLQKTPAQFHDRPYLWIFGSHEISWLFEKAQRLQVVMHEIIETNTRNRSGMTWKTGIEIVNSPLRPTTEIKCSQQCILRVFPTTVDIAKVVVRDRTDRQHSPYKRSNTLWKMSHCERCHSVK